MEHYGRLHDFSIKSAYVLHKNMNLIYVDISLATIVNLQEWTNCMKVVPSSLVSVGRAMPTRNLFNTQQITRCLTRACTLTRYFCSIQKAIKKMFYGDIYSLLIRSNTKNERTHQANIVSYDFSALVYLSDYGTDFEGGKFAFCDRSVIKCLHTCSRGHHVVRSL